MLPSKTNDFYSRLGISSDSSPEEIKSAYRRLSLKWHPDRNPPEMKKDCELEFIAVSEAYKELSSEARELFQRDYSGRTPDYNLYNDFLKRMNEIDPQLGQVMRMFMPNSPAMAKIFSDLFNEN